MDEISIEEFANRYRNGEVVNLLDVRTEAEFQTQHVAGAKLVTLDTLTADKVRAHFNNDAPIYVICRSGKRSQKAGELLAQEGISSTINVDGGTDGAVEIGLPINR